VSHSHQSLYVKTFVALLILLAITVAAAFLHVGHWSIVIAMTIACTKAFLILYLFMHLREEIGLIRLFAGVGFVWLGMMLFIFIADYATRHDVEPGPAIAVQPA
jgi:cytochrome c oxidase subunit 4